MIRIRLRRIGKKRQPYYRMVVANQQAKRDGAFLETLGSYDPHASPPALNIDEAKAREWIGKGAQPSEAAEKILRRAGIIAPAAPVKPGAKAAAKQAAATATAPRDGVKAQTVTAEPSAAEEAPAPEPADGETAEDAEA